LEASAGAGDVIGEVVPLEAGAIGIPVGRTAGYAAARPAKKMEAAIKVETEIVKCMVVVLGPVTDFQCFSIRS